MATKINLTNTSNGLTKTGYIGFSWTSLFFGGFVCFFRGETGKGFLYIFLSFITGSIWLIVMGFLYNKWHLKELLETGYSFDDSPELVSAARKYVGIFADNSNALLPRSHYIKNAIGIIFYILIGIAAALKTQEAGESKSNNLPKLSETVQTEATKNQEVGESQSNNLPRLGETVQTEYFLVTVNSIRFTDFVGNEFFNAKAESGNKLAVLNVTFKNIDSEGRMLEDGDLIAEYNGKRLVYDHTETILADGFLNFATLNPLTTITGDIVFQIPTELNGRLYYRTPRSSKEILLAEKEPATAVTSQPVATPPEAAVTSQPVATPPEAAVNASQTSWSPSFDCAKASTGPERLICNSKELSEADVQLNQAYKTAINKSTNVDELKNSQRNWRKTIRDACSNSDCMLNAYQIRINEIKIQ